jgi:pyruvate/2-oxoglutarate dehydrogenase complex dihydrolipoamide acyltransferase (E2) component
MSRPPASRRSSTASTSSIGSNFSELNIQGDPNQNLRRELSSTTLAGPVTGRYVPPTAEERLNLCLTSVFALQRPYLVRTSTAGNLLASVGGAPASSVPKHSSGISPGTAANVDPRNHLFSLYVLEEDTQQALYIFKHREFFPVWSIDRLSEAATAAEQLEKRVTEMTEVLQAPGLSKPKSFTAEQLQQVLFNQNTRVSRTTAWKYEAILKKQQQDPETIRGIVEEHKKRADDATDAWQIQDAQMTQDNSSRFLKMYRERQDYQRRQASHANTIMQNSQSASQLYGVLDSNCKACVFVRSGLNAMVRERRSGPVGPIASGSR